MPMAQDTILGRVGDHTLTLGAVVKSPVLQEELRALVSRAAVRHLILEEAANQGLEPALEELQAAADGIRRSRGLHRAEETRRWLEAAGLSPDDLEEEARFQVLRKRLRDRLSEARLEAYFHEHRASFDEVLVAHVVVKEEGVARELLTQLEEEESDFAALARQHSLDVETAARAGVIGRVRRPAVRPELEAALFGASPGAVLGPYALRSGWELVQAVEVRPAALNEATREEIREILFEEWLRERLASRPVKMAW